MQKVTLKFDILSGRTGFYRMYKDAVFDDCPSITSFNRTIDYAIDEIADTHHLNKNDISFVGVYLG